MSQLCARQARALLRVRPVSRLHNAPKRPFSSSKAAFDQQHESFRSRLNSALKRTKIEWKPIPVALGITFLGVYQFYRIQRREQHNQAHNEDGTPKKRERIRPSGPWQVQVMSTLPLKALSRVWGRFNELTIPYYLRVPGFKLYSFIFGVKYAPRQAALPYVY